uniref:Uncharacterized protein n=1 Tax=Anguilla anguilla TaxID=7936 RepID=A0A0E9XX36_ANGAN
MGGSAEEPAQCQKRGAKYLIPD